MARPRKPTAVLDARGAFKKDPQRKRHGEPIVKTPIGEAPADFNELQRAAYRQIMEQAPPGVLTSADTVTVEALANLLALFRSDRANFPIPAYGRMQSLLGTLGMTPADRSKLSIAPIQSENPFAMLG